MNDPNVNHAPQGKNPRRLRPPTVDEALQYSPFTSIVPFNSELLPFPAPIPVGSSQGILSEDELKTSRELLQELDSEAANSHKTSARFQQTVTDLRHLFKEGDLTQLHFRTPHSLNQYQPQGDSSSTTNGTDEVPNPRVKSGNFSTMLFNLMNVPCRYPSPVSPSLVSINGKHNHSTVKQESPRDLFKTTSAKINNLNAFGENTTSEYEFCELPTPQKSLTGHTSPSQSIFVVPPLLTSSNALQYENYPEIDQTILRNSQENGRKRKRDDEDEEGLQRISFDQNDKTQLAIRNLQEIIAQIFEAEDHLEPDTSGAVPSHASEVFVSVTSGDAQRFIIAPAVNVRLDTAMQKVIALGRFRDIPLEHLARLQKTCEAVLTAADGIDLTPSENDTDDDWSNRLDIADCSLRASKTLLRIMNALSDENQLCSEELLQQILDCLKHVIETCIVPVVEISNGSSCDNIESLKEQKQRLVGLLQRSGRVLKLLGDLLLQIDLSESTVTTIEFISTKLVFVETGPNEKDSLLGLQKFEAVRRQAMDTVAKVFFRRPEQRMFIFDEILSSLEKLPVTRQSARQFKVVDGKPIQLVSALIMQLVQTSATKSVQPVKEIQKDVAKSEDGEASNDEYSENEASPSTPTPRRAPTTIAISEETNSPLDMLLKVSKPLFESAQNNAAYVSKYLVQRALTSTKSGDQPYRNLLDIFTEDFVSVLGSPDWPAAEMLLRTVLSNFIGIIESEKSTAPAKNMALDLMGLMGSGIAEVQNYVRRNSHNADDNTPLNGTNINHLAEDVLSGKAKDSEVLSLAGPYRAVVDFLLYRDMTDLQIHGATSYFLSQWSRNIWAAVELARKQAEENDEDEDDVESWDYNNVVVWLESAITSRDASNHANSFEPISAAQSRLAYTMTVLTMPFCKAVKRILSILLTSLGSPHATVRSRSLKSVIQIVEKDPSILDNTDHIIRHILRCSSDQSSLVRDSALAFIGKCGTLKPELENEVCSALIATSSDSAVGVRKRAIKLLKDIYLRNKDKSIRSAIASAVLQRVADAEESVRELARQTIADVWLVPFHGPCENQNLSVQDRQDLQHHAWLIVATVQRGDAVLIVLETLFKSALAHTNKSWSANVSVCEALVMYMFDGIINNDSAAAMPLQHQILRTLTIFAKAQPSLFTPEQMIMLQPYIENLTTSDDLLIYRCVIIIYRWVLPVLPSLQHAFLGNVQSTLFKSVARLGKSELNEVSMCLWIINKVLKNTERLVKLTMSFLTNIDAAKNLDPSEPKAADALQKVRRYIMIAGYFGKACDLESHINDFRAKFPSWKDSSVSELMVSIILPFAASEHLMTMRQMAIESISLICQSWPRNYLKPEVNRTFEIILGDSDQKLQQLVLAGFKAFYTLEEARSQIETDAVSKAGNVDGAQKLGESYTVSDTDGASTAIAHQFLPQILRIALKSIDDLALLATEVIVSTNRQGLVHPKETGPALVALSTSPNESIAAIASEEHQNLHHKHESMLEKEYIRAIEETFAYQQNTVGDASGIVVGALRPKMKSFFDVLKTGSVQSRKKLYGNLCSKLNLNLAKMPEAAALDAHLLYARFVFENLGLVDYGRTDEILHLVNCIEKIFMSTGTILSQSIETLPGIHGDAVQIHDDLALNASTAFIDQDLTQALLLRRLTAVSVLMSMFWETRAHLMRSWGFQKYHNKAKSALKDLNRAPVRNINVAPEKLVSAFTKLMSSFSSVDEMRSQCRGFTELLAVDSDLKISSDGEIVADGYDTPSEEGGDNIAVPASGGSRATAKRRGSTSAASTPSKSRKKGRPSVAKHKSGSVPREDDDDGGWD